MDQFSKHAVTRARHLVAMLFEDHRVKTEEDAKNMVLTGTIKPMKLRNCGPKAALVVMLWANDQLPEGITLTRDGKPILSAYLTDYSRSAGLLDHP